MNWIIENLQILATLGSALSVYILLRISAKKDIKIFADEIRADIKEIKNDISSINSRLNLVEQRLSRFEGAFEERGKWESRGMK